MLRAWYRLRPSTKFAIKTALLLAGFGLLFSRFAFIQFLNREQALTLLLLWYVVLFAFIQVGSYYLFHRVNTDTMRVGVGLVLLWFAAGIVIYWPASEYSILVVGGDPASVPPYLIATEDELAFYFWFHVLNVKDLFWSGVLTYAVAPFLLVLAAVFLVTPESFRRAVKEILHIRR